MAVEQHHSPFGGWKADGRVVIDLRTVEKDTHRN